MTKLTEAEWHEIRVECAPPTDYSILRGLIEAAIDARLAPIRALADEGFNLTRPYGERCETCSTQYLEVGVNLTNLLRAALDAPVRASQDHDGAEGQP